MLPYTYVPGRCPHPISHPDGHRFLGTTHGSTHLDPENWQTCDAYIYAIELFNAGFHWEAHEVWEGCWIEAGRTGPLADFLKSLIKLAAAQVKAREGKADGVRRHARRANQLLAKLQETQDDDSLAGTSLADLRIVATQLHDSAERLTATHQTDDPFQPTPIARITLNPK